MATIAEGNSAKLTEEAATAAQSDPPESKAQAQPVVPQDESSSSALPKPGKKDVPHKIKEQTIRVDVDRLDNLMNLMGELVLGRNSLIQSSGIFSREHEDLKGINELGRSTSQINFITTEIQMAVMKIRMLPIGKVFSKFPRMVRDLSREMKKKIDLEIFGEETELDKSVIEEIGDPLVHLIRNSCDHGIEPADKRLAAGKLENGKVRLGAVQEGSNIVITIEDDGRGLDIEAIRRKAVERGLANAATAEKLSDDLSIPHLV